MLLAYGLFYFISKTRLCIFSFISSRLGRLDLLHYSLEGIKVQLQGEKWLEMARN
jgi:hypothetical protein